MEIKEKINLEDQYAQAKMLAVRQGVMKMLQLSNDDLPILADKKLNAIQQETISAYKYNNTYNFFNLYPVQYKQIAITTFRKWLNWDNGIVPEIHHDKGVFPTFCAPSIRKVVANLTVGGGLNYDVSRNTSIPSEQQLNDKDIKAVSDRITEWANTSKFDDTVFQATNYMLAGGTSIIRANKYINSKGQTDILYTAHRLDRFLPVFNEIGRLVACKIYIQEFATTMSNNYESGNYTLIENRYINEKGIPVRKLQMIKDSAPANTKVFTIYNSSVPFKNLPSQVQKSFKEFYPNSRLDEEEVLGFKTIGVFLFKATDTSSISPDLPFGDSLFANATSYLTMLDVVTTKRINDIYISSGRVYLPSTMTPDKFMGDSMNDSINRNVPTQSNDFKAEAVQFNIRAGEWGSTINDTYNNLALSIGIGTSYWMPDIQKFAVDKTATQVSSEQSMTVATIEQYRNQIYFAINQAIQLVLDFYNITDYFISAKFPKSGLTNTQANTNDNVLRFQNGVQSLFTTISNLNPDWSDAQINDEINRIKNDLASNVTIKAVGELNTERNNQSKTRGSELGNDEEEQRKANQKAKEIRDKTKQTKETIANKVKE